MRKVLNVKVPAELVQRLDNNAHLNPYYFKRFLEEHTGKPVEDADKPRTSLIYPVKMESELHAKVVYWAEYYGLSISEYTVRLLLRYYK